MEKLENYQDPHREKWGADHSTFCNPDAQSKTATPERLVSETFWFTFAKHHHSVDSGYEPYGLAAKDLENENRTAQKVNWPVLIQTEWLVALLKLL